MPVKIIDQSATSPEYPFVAEITDTLCRGMGFGADPVTSFEDAKRDYRRNVLLEVERLLRVADDEMNAWLIQQGKEEGKS